MDKYMLSNKEVGKGLLDDTEELNEEWIGAGSDITARKQAEDALRESELKYRYLFDSINEGFCIIEVLMDDNEQPFDYRFLEVNSAFERQTGLVNAQGRCIRELIPYLEQYWFDIYGRVAKTGESTRFQNSVEEMGRFYDVYAFRIGEPEKRRVAVLFDDTTEHRRLEKALRQSEEHFRISQENSPDRFSLLRPIFDRQGQVIDFIYLYENPTGARLFGLSPTEVIGRRIGDLYPSFYKTRFFEEFCRVALTGNPVVFEDHYESDGVNEWLRAAVTPIADGIAASTQFITERKKMEEALREREEKCSELVKHAPSGIYELDLRNNRFISINDVMCELTGYSKEEFREMNPSDFLDTEGKKLFGKRMEEWLLGRKPESHVDYKVRTKDRRELYVSLNVNFTRDEDGEPLGAMVIAHDVTVRKKMEEALRRSEEELRNEDKSKNNFISVLSHELRNPLATISAGISILEMSENKLQTEKAKEIMKRQIGQLCKLVDDLMDLTRITQNKIQLKKEDIVINNLVMNAAKDTAFSFENKGVRFSVEIQSKPILIHADPVRITQSIGNLLYNALKFTLAGGTVLLSLTQEKDRAVIMVKDNGIGVSKEILPNLFKPFTQADNSLDRQNNGGLGLGLYIVKGIVDMHQGTVTANSEGLGKGSLFTIRLPVIFSQPH